MTRNSNNNKRGRRPKNRQSNSSSFAMQPLGKMMRADPCYTVTKRVVSYANVTSSASIETFSASGITLNAFTGYGSLTAAFDYYRFDMVEYEFLPRLTINDGVVSNAGVFISVVDFDDITLLSSTNQALAYPNAQVWTGATGKTNLLRHRFVPRIAIAAYQGAFSGYANMTKQWVDTGTPGVAHYGVKTAWSVTSTPLSMDLVITATISFRGSRA
jgi:hypothetical protein